MSSAYFLTSFPSLLPSYSPPLSPTPLSLLLIFFLFFSFLGILYLNITKADLEVVIQLPHSQHSGVCHYIQLAFFVFKLITFLSNYSLSTCFHSFLSQCLEPEAISCSSLLGGDNGHCLYHMREVVSTWESILPCFVCMSSLALKIPAECRAMCE